MSDYEALREAAEKATPGPWEWATWWPSSGPTVVTPPPLTEETETTGVATDKGAPMFVQLYSANEEVDEYEADIISGDGADVLIAQYNATYIAAANPSTILALLDRLEELEKQHDNDWSEWPVWTVQSITSEWPKWAQKSHSDYLSLCLALNAAQDRLEAAERVVEAAEDVAEPPSILAEHGTGPLSVALRNLDAALATFRSLREAPEKGEP